MVKPKLKIGVLASGSGTNLQNIIDKCNEGYLPVEIVVVISNKEEAYALERARKHNIPAFFVDRKSHSSSDDFNNRIFKILKEHQVEIVVMAGYMLFLGKEILRAFPNKVLNIHPALLPSFPGAHGIEDAYNYGVKVTGVTVHFADEKYDSGPIILQEALNIEEGMHLKQLEEEIHKIEYRIYPKAIKLLAEGKLKIEGRKVIVL